MRILKILIVLILLSLLNACCLVTSKDCNCKAPEPYLDQKVVEWQIPYSDETLIFTNQISDTLFVDKVYSIGKECIGGDECCTNFEKHTTTWFFDESQLNVILHSSSIQNKVLFETDNKGYPGDTFIYELTPSDNNEFSTNKFYIHKSDSILKGQVRTKLKITRADSISARFNQLIFLESEGIIEFTDLESNIWKKE